MADNNRLRVHTVSFKADTGDATSQTISFTMALRENEAAENSVKKAYGDTATVQEKVVKNTKELTREARSLVTQTVNQERRATALVREYTHLASLTGKTAQEQEVLNAVYRLGANATNEQVASIAHLVNSQQKLTNSSGGAQKSMRNLRGVSQNLGWQVQDVAVQMQMGTNAFVIFSQQGSQLASAFGPTGALVGAFIAVAGALGGVIYKSLTGVSSAKDLAEAQKLVNQVFEDGAIAADGLSTKYTELFEKNKTLAILTAQKALSAAKAQRKTAKDELREQVDAQFKLIGLFKKGSDDEVTYNAAIEKANKTQIEKQKKYAKELGINLSQLQDINSSLEKGAYGNFAEKLATITTNTKGALNPLVKMASGFYETSQKATDAAEQIDTLNKIIASKTTPDKPDDKLSDVTKAFEAERDSLIQQTETTDQEYKRRKAHLDAYVKQQGDISIEAAGAYENLEQWKTGIHDAELLKQHKADQAAAEKKAKADEKALLKIAKAQSKQLKTTDPTTVEKATFGKNMLELQNQRDEAERLKHFDKVKEINLLMEAEVERDADVNNDIASSATQQQLQNYSTILSGMTTVMGQLSGLAEEGSADAKAMFYINQALALANIAVSTSVGAAKATEMGLFGIPMAEYIVGFGAAQAAIVAGTTFAGAYDSGGVIPSGQAGIVAENYDEFVGGTMVYNNSGSGLNVTGSKDTANSMGGAGGNTIIVQQSITVSGNGDKALKQAMTQAAKKGAEDGAKKGYNMVKLDFNTGRGIRRDLKKSIGA